MWFLKTVGAVADCAVAGVKYQRHLQLVPHRQGMLLLRGLCSTVAVWLEGIQSLGSVSFKRQRVSLDDVVGTHNL